MDIGLLKTFLEINRTKHFGQAADNLFLTQSAVSARIKLLEQIVGVPLFTRSRNNIELTSAGMKLVKHADSIINVWNRARQEIAVEDTAQIPLSVGGVPSIWDILLQSWLSDIAKHDPHLVINAEVHGPELLVRRLIDRSLDVAFTFESLLTTELIIEEVAEINLIMVSTNANISVMDAIRESYVLVDWGTSFANTHAQYFQENVSPRLRVHLGRIAHAFLLDCGGSAYLAETMVEQELKMGTFHKVEDAPIIKRKAYAAYSPVSDKQETINNVLKELLTDR